ncbi:MAG: hypothetical protein ACRDOY_11300 [Nocardioidaceae bacterium]
MLAPASVTAVWVSAQLSDTDRYVTTVTPLATDPAVQSAVASTVTRVVFENLGVEALTTEALRTVAEQPNVPPRLAGALPDLAVPLSSGIESFTRDQVNALLGSPKFAPLWAEMNRIAHRQVVILLEGAQGTAVSAQNDAITLNLGPVVAAVKARLVGQGFELAHDIPRVDTSFVLAQSDAIGDAQGIYRLLNTLGAWLPLIALAVFVLGVLLARDRRRAVRRGALGVVAAMVGLALLLALARAWYVETTPADVLTADAAGGVFDALVRSLRTGLRGLAVLGLVVALAAFLTGPASAAVKTRATVQRGIGSARLSAESAGWNTGQAGTWIYRHKTVIRVSTVIAAGLVMVFWTQPTGWVVVTIASVVAVLIALLELLARPPTPAATVAAAGEPT